MKILKKILYGLLILFLVIQVIRPTRNISDVESANDITKHYQVPLEVSDILKTSCFDCHSNNTVYPWYSNIQPVGWWMQWHVNDGKKHLNFSEFASYTPKKAHHKFEEITEMVKEGEMPLFSYTIIHGNAKLSDVQKQQLVQWADGLRMQMNMPEEKEDNE